VTSQFTPPQKAFYLKLINRLGNHLGRAGVVVPRLDTQRLIRHAAKKTGLQDFGDESFREGLEVLVRALNDEAQLSQIGQVVAYYNLLDHLCVRLSLIAYRTQRPEVLEQQVQQPLFILGLPRTGTTILYELIAQDPDFRSAASWEVSKPVPPAAQETFSSDSRIKHTDRLMSLMEKLAPGFRAIHAIEAKLPQECVYLLASHFISEQYCYMYNIPQYRAWALDQDMTAAYQWHADFLRHLQVDYSSERWVLKTPAHLAYLKDLFKQYPDAAVIWTHRRPVDAVASFSSLTSTLHGGFSDSVDPLVTGPGEYEHYSKVVDRGMAQRNALDPGRFFDVSYSAICSDPVSVVESIYAHFGWDFGSEAQAKMHAYIKQRPRGLYGEHHYSREAYGLEESREESLYASYLSQYGKYLD
jgi:hypothetical protein